MSIIVKTDRLVFGLLTKSYAEATKILIRRIKDRFVRDLETQTFELMLKVRTDGFESLVGWERVRVDPTLEGCAWVRFDDIRGVDVDVQTEDESSIGSLELSGSATTPWKEMCRR